MTAAPEATPRTTPAVVHVSTAAVDLLGWPLMLSAARTAALLARSVPTSARARVTHAIAWGLFTDGGHAVPTAPADARVVRISTTIEEPPA